MRIPTFFLALLTLGFLAGGSVAANGVRATAPSPWMGGRFIANGQAGEAPGNQADSEKESGKGGTEQSADQKDEGTED
ncbi:MAG: hypothetical protein HKM06_02130 [Spirochaetales bacterium]|nr:hypothetical protein [Spirochaetales bacterium]